VHPEVCPEVHPEVHPEVYPAPAGHSEVHAEVRPEVHPEVHPDPGPSIRHWSLCKIVFVRLKALCVLQYVAPVVLLQCCSSWASSFRISPLALGKQTGCDRLQCCHQRVRKGSAAPAGLTSLTSDAVSCHRVGGQQHQQQCSAMPSCRM